VVVLSGEEGGRERLTVGRGGRLIQGVGEVRGGGGSVERENSQGLLPGPGLVSVGALGSNPSPLLPGSYGVCMIRTRVYSMSLMPSASSAPMRTASGPASKARWALA